VAGTRAVLFDWRGILVADPPDEWWVRRALVQIARPHPSDTEVAEIVTAINAVANLPAFVDSLRTVDCSADLHAQTSIRMFSSAGLEEELAVALYELDFQSDCHPYAADAEDTLKALASSGIKIAVVSDIHFDLRPEFAAQGLVDLIDAFVLSFEHGVQKPNPAIFNLALSALGIQPTEALMVGDRPSHDGGAVAVGIPTLLLPPLRQRTERRLDVVLRTAGAGRNHS
jgi:HAD superfamily hydrolase (TIGR01509 family)